jgi:uncharacterized GH25 family protein
LPFLFLAVIALSLIGLPINRKGNESAIVQYSRTDENGICSFKLEREGDWFIHSTHMIESPDKNDADWESFWTTFSFGMKETE